MMRDSRCTDRDDAHLAANARTTLTEQERQVLDVDTRREARARFGDAGTTLLAEVRRYATDGAWARFLRVGSVTARPDVLLMLAEHVRRSGRSHGG